ncbi:GNS1/SUR4 family-domain-containing protein [Absidia repens]|uniref:Elongation of fatty acids protein n=1 Tax=Absidia repens TaxID=90262 RepID=A0A1X2ILF9_9FUNG|nr:GNS1/SUR4 family-domain-containing protein [Absidia repens]
MEVLKSLQFTPETPFGLRLYPYFEQVYQAVTGQKATDFVFTPGVTPLSTVNEVVTSCITYFIVIFGGRYLMQNLPAQRLQFFFQIHNLLLTLVSGALLVLMVENIFPILYHKGLLHAVCATDAWTQPLELLYYLNYLVKYWELIDTIFLVLKKKKLEFLHYYHHSLTMVLCYTQLGGQTSVSWVPIVLNLTVHVLMYYYYFRTASGAKIWWKRYLTTMQIVQFVIDLFAIYFCTYTYFAYTYYPHMPNMGSCAGTETSAIFGCALLSSYLLLFINFYRITYNKNKSLKKKAAAANSTAAAAASQQPKSKKI